MKSILLAAGYATRMYPLTENFPKPLLPVSGKPILNWLLEDIDDIPEITGHVVITNHKFIENLKKWRESLNLKKPLTILDDGSIDNDHRLGAVKDIQFAVEQLHLNDDLLILAGDNLLTFSLKEFAEFFKGKNASCVMCHEENDLKKQQRTAIITKDENDLITSYEEKPDKPKGNLAVPPFYCYKEEDIARIPDAIKNGCGTDAPGSLAAWLSTVTNVYAWKMPGKRCDIGNIETYEEVKLKWPAEQQC